MNRFKFSILISVTVALISFVMSEAVYAAEDSTNLRLVRVTTQTQQPTTMASSSKSYAVKPDKSGNVSCPEGYALTNLNSTGESYVAVSVFTECNGVGSWYVHSWCKNGEKIYKPTSHAPTVTYTCQKIQNQWVAVNK